VQFKKLALSTGDLFALLQRRGLPLTEAYDQKLTYDALSAIGYYRLSGYMLPFQEPTGWKKHHFKPSASIQKILALYKFDTELRNHCGEALGEIEVAMRTSICDHMARQYGAHWQLNAKAFKPLHHEDNLNAFAKAAGFNLDTSAPKRRQGSGHLFLDSYYSRYTSPKFPASWMVRECASFGTWAIVYKDIPTADQKEIANFWHYPNGKPIDHVILDDWFHSLSVFRNRCAHHSRITNRKFPFPPKATTEISMTHLFTAQTTDLRTLLVVTALLLRRVNPKSNWVNRLSLILNKHPLVDIQSATGMENSAKRAWDADPIWGIPNLS
jgi:abortive infection bacteriophage resistance protein